MSLIEITENKLRDQARALRRTVSLIEEKTPWTNWNDDDKSNILLALHPVNASLFEEMKAKTLARHLFRDNAPASSEIVTSRPDLADRLRADLAGLVRLGAGRHLLADLKKEADEEANYTIKM